MFPQLSFAQGGTCPGPGCDQCEGCGGGIEDPPGKPTAIELSYFSAERKTGAVVLTWTTGSEVNNEGFNIYRAESLTGPFIRINPSLIPARGSIGGGTYSLTDTDLKDGQTYYYRLEDINVNGVATAHNTLTVNPILATNTKPEISSAAESPVSPSPVSTANSMEASKDSIRRDGTTLHNTIIANSILVPSDEPAIQSLGETPLSSSFIGQPLQEPGLPGSDLHDASRVTSLPEKVLPRSHLADPQGPQAGEPSNDSNAASTTTVTFAYTLEEPNGNNLSVAKESGAVKPREEIKTSFRAYGADDGAILEWHSDEATYGFNIWRSEERDKDYIQVNDALISYMDIGEKHRERVSYVYKDRGVKKGNAYFYVLMKMDTYGGEAVYFGPVKVTPEAMASKTGK